MTNPHPAPSFLLRLPGAVWACLLALVPVLLYLPSLDAPLVFDDAGAVATNQSIRSLDTAWSPPADGGTTTGRPLLNFAFALNYLVSGDSVRGWHLGNLALHGLATALVFAVLARLWGRRMPAAAASLVWSIHPLNTESVICIAQRSELLCAVLYLGAVGAFLAALARPDGRRVPWLAVCVACSAAGMAAKEVTVTLPLIILLLDRGWGAGSLVAAWRARRGFYLALASTWGVLGALLWQGGGSRGTSAGVGLGIGVWEYLLKQAEAVAHYVRLVFWPHPLVVDYGFGVPASWLEVAWQGPSVLALLGVAAWALWRFPRGGLIGAWWFVILSPSSSFVPLVAQTMAEHRIYLPLVGPVAGLVWVFFRWVRFWPVVVVPWLAVLAGLTLLRQEVYRSPLRLWEQTVEAYPSSARAHLNLGLEYLREQRHAEARSSFARALALAPGYALAHYNAGVSWQTEGRWPEARQSYQEAVRLAPRNADMRLNFAVALARTGRGNEAVRELSALVQNHPSPEVSFNLGWLLVEQGDMTAARQALDQAVASPSPARVDWLRRTSRWAISQQDWDMAARHLRWRVEATPDDFEAWGNLGNVCFTLGQYRTAVEAYERALALRPQEERIRENLRLAREAGR